MVIESTKNTRIKSFLDENFLLENETAERLYHEFAKNLPHIDYHNHLPPDQIAADQKFENLTKVWLNGDHYKWRAMRANGINEHFITGASSDFEKFEKWAETVPMTIRNPLFHWTHLELQRYFGIKKILKPESARAIYDDASEQLNTSDFSVKNLLRKMNVEVVGTTDDPLDTLEYHQQIKAQGFEVKVVPSFRPDKFILIDNPNFSGFVSKLSAIVGFDIKNYDDLLRGLRQRADFFKSLGCKATDHGLEQIYASDFTQNVVNQAFVKAIAGENLTAEEALQFKSCILIDLGEMYHDLGFVQQFHLGALRNNNARLLAKLGPDTGWDSIGDLPQAASLSKFLNRLESKDRLAKTVVYNLNPADNEVFATMIGNFNDGSVAGKVQWGSGWWFLDQKDGMEKQLNTLSNMGLLSQFIGMLTDSRSFCSFPRHEYFRRILCNLIGKDVHNGELPNDIEWLGGIVSNICYYNAKRYFEF